MKVPYFLAVFGILISSPLAMAAQGPDVGRPNDKREETAVACAISRESTEEEKKLFKDGYKTWLKENISSVLENNLGVTVEVRDGTPYQFKVKKDGNKIICDVGETIEARMKNLKEAIVQLRFFNGKLIYRPDRNSDAGRIEMPFAALANPLEGTFDLSRCGDTGQYLSISTGYRKGKKPENADKTEIWIAPRFLVERELATTAGHFKDIWNNWQPGSPFGIFWTWGNDNDLTSYDCLTNKSIDGVDDITVNNLFSDWCAAVQRGAFADSHRRMGLIFSDVFVFELTPHQQAAPHERESGCCSIS